jgi:glycosyltransferase involved in cell wall biosynthesis
MKIAVVTPRYYPHLGGVEKQVQEVCERLVKRDFDIQIFTTDPTKKLMKEEVVNDVNVKRFPSWAPNESYCFSSQLREFLQKTSNDYEIIHAHQYHAIPALYVSQTKNKNNFVFNPHYHGKGHTFFRNLLHKPYRMIGKNIFNNADKIICVSEYEKNLMKADFDVNNDKIHIIPNGVDYSEFKGITREKKDHIMLLTVSRLEKYKGVQHIITAIQGLPKEYKLNIIGDGTFKENLIDLSRKLNVEDRVFFYQNLSRDALLKKYFEADLFMLLSTYEAYGISVAEALASGTPCIVANASALTEWVDNENCFGINFPIDYGQLKKLVMENSCKEIKYTKLFDWEDIADKLADVYRGV